MRINVNCNLHKNTNSIAKDVVIDNQGNAYLISSIRLPDAIYGEMEFETMVFTVDPDRKECGCFEVTNWLELDCRRSSTLQGIMAEHEDLVRKYSERSRQ